MLRTTSLFISARISEERILASSVSASRPCIALRSCASSIVYSALRARVTAVTVCFSIENAISPNALVPESPSASPCTVVIPVAEV